MVMVTGNLPPPLNKQTRLKTLAGSNIYRPQTKLQKGNVFTAVCQSFCSHGEGVCPSACWDTLPWADTPGQTPHPG